MQCSTVAEEDNLQKTVTPWKGVRKTADRAKEVTRVVGQEHKYTCSLHYTALNTRGHAKRGSLLSAKAGRGEELSGERRGSVERGGFECGGQGGAGDAW